MDGGERNRWVYGVDADFYKYLGNFLYHNSDSDDDIDDGVRKSRDFGRVISVDGVTLQYPLYLRISFRDLEHSDDLSDRVFLPRQVLLWFLTTILLPPRCPQARDLVLLAWTIQKIIRFRTSVGRVQTDGVSMAYLKIISCKMLRLATDAILYKFTHRLGVACFATLGGFVRRFQYPAEQLGWSFLSFLVTTR